MQIVAHEEPRLAREIEIFELQCHRCGFLLELSTRPEKKICPHCGAELSIKWAEPRFEALN